MHILYTIVMILTTISIANSLRLGRATSHSNSWRLMAKQVTGRSTTKQTKPAAKFPVPASRPNIAYVDPTQYTEEEFADMLRVYRKGSATKCIEKLVTAYHIEQKLSTNMTYSTIKSSQIINSSALAEFAYQKWNSSSASKDQNVEQNLTPLVGMVKIFCKLGKLDIAESIGETILLSENQSMAFSIPQSNETIPAKQEVLNHLALGHTMRNNLYQTSQYLSLLNQSDFIIDNEISKKIVKHFLNEATNITQIIRCMRLLVNCNGLQDTEAIQFITNKFLFNMTFIKGAVSMETLPPAELPEVMFIGRSNVGKSSLINMVTNKKNLAFTSKTAGKTSEFNYFEATGKVGANKKMSRFYLVDVPGVGYAERSKGTKSKWIELQKEYTSTRSTLRCIFHLVDSRHGLLEADNECLDLLLTMPDYVKYVIVFTKIDKLRAGRKDVLIKPEMLTKVSEAVKQRTQRDVPVIFSSSETRLGGCELLTTILECANDM